jgi:hypothetical protein
VTKIKLFEGCESSPVKMEVPMEVCDSDLNSKEKLWEARCISEILKEEDTKFSNKRYFTSIIIFDLL